MQENEHVELLDIKSEEEYSAIRKLFKKIGNAILSHTTDTNIYVGELLQIKDGKSKTNNAINSENTYSDVVMKEFYYKRGLFGLYAIDIKTNKLIPTISVNKPSRIYRHTFVRTNTNKDNKGKFLCTSDEVLNAIFNPSYSSDVGYFIKDNNIINKTLEKYNLEKVEDLNNLKPYQKLRIANSIKDSYINKKVDDYNGKYRQSIGNNCIKKEKANFEKNVFKNELNKIYNDMHKGKLSDEEGKKRIEKLNNYKEIQEEYIKKTYVEMPDDLMMHRFYKMGKKDVTIKGKYNDLRYPNGKFNPNENIYNDDSINNSKNKESNFNNQNKNKNKDGELGNDKPNTNKESTNTNEQPNRENQNYNNDNDNKQKNTDNEQVKNEKQNVNGKKETTQQTRPVQNEQPKPMNNNQQTNNKQKTKNDNIVKPTSEDINNYWKQKSVKSNDKKIIITSAGKTIDILVAEMISIANLGQNAVSNIEGVELDTNVLRTREELIEYFMCKRYGQQPKSKNVQMVLMDEKGKINKQM